MRIILKLIFSIILNFLLLFSVFRAESKEYLTIEPSARVNTGLPIAIDVKNFLIQNISGRSQILPLIGSDADGTIASFKILSLPNNAHGTLYLNNVAVINNQVLNPVEAKQLQFEVKSTFTGTASFTYTVTDNNGNSALTAATFSIPVTNDGTLLVCSGGGLGNNILGAQGTFSSPFITANSTVNCINNNSNIASPSQNLGNAKPGLTSYNYASTSGGLGPEGTYSFLKTLGTMATRNCIKTDWVASDHTGDGGYAMIVNGSPNSATFGKTFYNASSITVCPNTLYEFSAYVINVLPGDHSAALPGTEPNISFYINNQLVSTSGAIAYSDASTGFKPSWVKVGGLWYSGPNTSVNLRIDNATFVASGNDLGLDDISLAICGPEITYPEISLTPKFCSYGVLPLKADIKASVNTYASYIFQNSTDGGFTWTDMGSPATGSPVYNSSTGFYEYQAVYGDIPIDPSMNGYRYRLKVATEAGNLTGLSCNISADKIITVSAFEKPLAGVDITGCNSSSTAKLKAAGVGETWSVVAGNPAAASIDQSGNVAGMVSNGFYKFQLTNSSGCADTVSITRDQIESAGADVGICSPQTGYKFADAGPGYKWRVVAGNPAAASIDSLTGQVSGMSIDGNYRFILQSDFGGCTDEVIISRSTLSVSSASSNVNCYGTSTGAINLTVSGGTAPYTYAWSSGQTSEDLSALAAGSYTVTVTDAKGCTATATIEITQPAAVLALSSTQTNVNCYGASTGSINLSVSGGTAPYTYAWSSGQITEDLSALAAGSYTITVTDSKGCTVTATIEITQPSAALALSSTQINVNCYGASTGSINLSVSGGTAPYTYVWSSGQTSEDLSALGAGSYSVTVTDAKGCTATATIEITQPSAALTLSRTLTNVNCYGTSTGSINLSVSGGTAPYTYSWSSGQMSEDLTALGAGNYTVTVTDSKGCIVSETIEITQPAAALALNSTQTNVNCYGASTGAINLTVSGGTAPYTYAWSSGQTSEDLSALLAGSYTVTVTDSKGCTATATIEITQPAAALALSITQTNVNCYGASTGSINLSVSGGTAPYTYSWSSGQTSEDLSALGAGSYSVTVTDAKGCTATATIEIIQPAAALALSSSKVNVNCYGESTGAINLTVSGGTAPYTYAWSSGQTTEDLSALLAGSYTVAVTDVKGCTATAMMTITQPSAALALSSTQTNVNCYGASTGSINLSVSGGTAPYTYAWNTGQITEDLSALVAGSYTIMVTDAKGCTETATIEITQPGAALTLSRTQTNVNCYGASTGAINLTVSGGTAPYTYTWSSGQTSEDLSAMAAGSYTVTVTDAKGCTATATMTITQPDAALALSSTQTNVNCYGESTGAINLTVSGGTAPYTYVWSSGQTTKDLSVLAAGSYTITVTDSKGCTVTATIEITQPSAALALSRTQTNVNCYGASTGSINLSVSGGTAPYTYSWSSGQTTEDLSALVAGSYTVTVTDSKGCTATATIEITQPAAALALSSTQTNINCYGASTGSINLSVSGGTAPYTYSWISGQTSEDLSALAEGSYTVTVTDAKGCTATATMTITQPAAALALSSTQTNVNCYGASTGSINLSISGGTAPYTYAWNTGQTIEDLSALGAGSYSVTVTDAKGCTATARIEIIQPAAPIALTSTQINVNCYGASTGSINLSVSGGTAPYTYAWSSGQTTEDPSALVAGSYSVIVTDANGCTATAMMTITQPSAALALSSTQTNVNCYGASTGSINLSVSGGTAPYTYAWNTGQTSEDLSSLLAGSYTVTVTDSKGCAVTETIEIIQPAAAIALTSTQTNVNCYGASTGSINLSVSGGTAPYTYSWSSGQTSEDLTALLAGSYTVEVTDSKGCTATATIEITQPAAALAISSTQTNVNCYGESTGAINLTVSGGTAPYTYAWSSGQTTEDLSALLAGSYTVTVTDAKGCTATATIEITQPAAALALSSSKVNVNCYGESTGAISLTVSGGTAPYTYAWSSGQTIEDLSALAAGNYIVTVTDAKGCTATAMIEITQPAAALALSSTQNNVNCYGESTGAINLTVSGGTAPYTYAWSSGQTTEDLIALAAGTYTVTVTDSKGCVVTETIEITQPAAALALNSTQTNVSCYGESTGAINLTVSGGTAPYTYAWSSGQTTEDLSALAAGSYTITVADAKGCTTTATIEITQPAAALALSSIQTNVNCYGESTGAINLTVSGGTAPYTYVWSSGQTTKDLSVLAAGSYTITVTDSKGCTVTATIEITQPSAALALSRTQTNVNCYGASTGSINLSVSGGTAPYTYVWSSGQTTEDLSTLAAGSYSVTVTDAKGCTATSTIEITQPSAALALSSTQTDVNCYGTSTGAINLTVSGGTAPYTYAWSSGQTTEDSSALVAGSYTVTVTDSKGCTATATIEITQPAAALALSSTQTNINCYGASTGSINLSVSGGTSPYTYAWSSGQTSEDLSALLAGNYIVTVTDAKGCTATATIEITQPSAALALSSTQTNVNCYGASTGSINLSVSGGTSPYTYSWNTGQTSEDLSALLAGNYIVTVTDAKGCTATATIEITQPSAAFALSSTQTNVNCHGASTGSINLSVFGGTAPYTYAWNTGQTTEDLGALAAGSYNVTVTDAKGCSGTASVIITQPDKLSISFIVKNSTCSNTSDGAISTKITGGNAPYTLIWNTNKDLNKPDLNNIQSGKYALLVTDSNGCTVSAETEIFYGNCIPLAKDDGFKTEQQVPFTGDVSPNDSDPNNQKLTFLKLSDPKNGKIAFNSDGKFSFQPDSGFNGLTEFIYQLCNLSGNCVTAKVQINVSPVSMVKLTPEFSSVREGDKVSITARLMQKFPEDVFVTIEYQGKAEREKDYLVLDNYQGLRIPKGSLYTSDKITVAALNDAFEEGNEDIVLKIKTVSNPAVKIGTGALVSITDVYPPPPPTDVPGIEIDNKDITIDPLLSPNDDGIGNEYLLIKNIENYPDNEIFIFNRWGNELFYLKGYNNQDKIFKGYANKGLLSNTNSPLTDGVYYYLINTFEMKDGVRTKKLNKGYLILKR